MSRMVGLPLVHRKVRMLYLVAFLALIAISLSAFAASVTITNVNDAGYQGVYVQDNGYYTVSGTNFYVVQAAQAATASGAAFANGASVYVNALVAGDWELSFVLTIQGGLTSHPYTITVSSTTATGTVTQLFQYIFNSPGTITAGNAETIMYDMGGAGGPWTAPAALTITIA